MKQEQVSHVVPVLELGTIRAKSPGHHDNRWPKTLFSNEVHHLADTELSAERCALVRAAKWPGQVAVYSKDSLASATLLSSEIAAMVGATSQIAAETLVGGFRQQLARLHAWKKNLAGLDTCYRVVHGEADGLPGLVIDVYGSLAVIQSFGQQGDFLLPWVIEAWRQLEPSGCLLERSASQARIQAGLAPRERTLFGVCPEKVTVRLAGVDLSFVPLRAQKTGLFLDQRTNLETLGQWLSPLAASMGRPLADWKVLDLCCYAGAWSTVAARAGCRHFVMVDQDRHALELARDNVTRAAVGGGIEATNSAERSESAPEVVLREGDLFEELASLRSPGSQLMPDHGGAGFELVVADPPAFARSRKNLAEASRAYARLVRQASRLVSPGGVLVVCSCSRPLELQAFEELVEKQLVASSLAGREQGLWWARLHRGGQGPDHTVAPGFQGSDYLKCLFYQKRKV